MDRINLIVKEENEFRLNRLACQHPLCFPHTYKPEKFAINRGRKGTVLSKGGKDSMGYLFQDAKNGRAYSVGMALSYAQQFMDNGENPLPGAFDQKVLMGLVSLAIKNNQNHIDFASTYAILKALEMGTRDKDYDALWNSFDKWSKTSIVYQKSIRVFGKKGSCKKTITIGNVICVDTSYWDDEKEAGVHIQFTDRFLELLGIKFSVALSHSSLLKLKGSTALNLYNYLRGISGFLEEGKTVTRNTYKLCVDKMAINNKAAPSKMRFYLIRAVESINKITEKGKYNLVFNGENVDINYRVCESVKQTHYRVCESGSA